MHLYHVKAEFCMKKLLLNGKWNMQGAGFCCDGTIPGSVYSFLIDNKLMDDPFYRDNEREALKLMENDFTFSKKFIFQKQKKHRKLYVFQKKQSCTKQILVCIVI